MEAVSGGPPDGGSKGPSVYLHPSCAVSMDQSKGLGRCAGFTSQLGPIEEGVRLATAFSGINLLVCIFWTYAGTLLAYLLNTPATWAMFLRGMAVAMAASALLIFV